MNRLKLITVSSLNAYKNSYNKKTMGHRIHKGLCITKKGHNLPLQYFKTIESGHPVPDDQSFEAGIAVEYLLKEVKKNDFVLVLISGGASSLMMDCPAGLSKNDIQRVYDVLIKSGADIAEMNLIRTALSNLKGGGMSKLVYPEALVTLAISDVCGDHPEVIGSGPTVNHKTNYVAIQKVIHTYELNKLLPAVVLKYDGIEDLKTKIKPFEHGVILEYQNKRATFLPQVWDQIPNFEDFFTQLSKKAGFSKSCLDLHPIICTYTAIKIK